MFPPCLLVLGLGCLTFGSVVVAVVTGVLIVLYNERSFSHSFSHNGNFDFIQPLLQQALMTLRVSSDVALEVAMRVRLIPRGLARNNHVQ